MDNVVDDVVVDDVVVDSVVVDDDGLDCNVDCVRVVIHRVRHAAEQLVQLPLTK